MASVLNALGGPKKGGAVPYRDSVITRVLQVRYNQSVTGTYIATCSVKLLQYPAVCMSYITIV